MVDNRTLYYVKIPAFGPEFWELGIFVEIWDHDEDGKKIGPFLCYHSTCRAHQLRGHLEKETENGFIWHWCIEEPGQKPIDNGFITFEALTLEEFNKKVRPHVWGVPEFNSTEELHEWYRREFEDVGMALY